MSRRKQQTVHVPADRAEAEQMLAELVSIERDVLKERLIAQTYIDKIKAAMTENVTGLEAERSDLFAGLKAWWEAGGAKELAGRNRSADVMGASIGIRKTPPSLKLPRKTKAADIVKWLCSLRLMDKAKWLRRPAVQLDKQAVIKTMRAGGPLAEMFEEKGLSLEQADEFFIDAGLDEELIKKQIAAL